MEDPEFEASLGYTERPPLKTSKAYSLAFQSNILRSKLQFPWHPEAGVLTDETTCQGQRALGLEGQVPFGWKQISFL